jgi:hypothetical protein
MARMTARRGSPLYAAAILAALALGCGTTGERAADGGDGDAAAPPDAATGALGECIPITGATLRSCNEVCMRAGSRCVAACRPMGALRHESAYYPDGDACARDRPVLQGLTGCSESWATAQLLSGAEYVRCCCE